MPHVLETRPGRGRCYVADRSYAVGDVILRERPYAVVTTDAVFSSGGCAHCLCFPKTVDAEGASITTPVFATCEDDWARYCSPECMSADAKLGHGGQMKACQELIESGKVAGSSDALRLVLKIAGRFKREQMEAAVRERQKQLGPGVGAEGAKEEEKIKGAGGSAAAAAAAAAAAGSATNEGGAVENEASPLATPELSRKQKKKLREREKKHAGLPPTTPFSSEEAPTATLAATSSTAGVPSPASSPASCKTTTTTTTTKTESAASNALGSKGASCSVGSFSPQVGGGAGGGAEGDGGGGGGNTGGGTCSGGVEGGGWPGQSECADRRVVMGLDPGGKDSALDSDGKAVLWSIARMLADELDGGKLFSELDLTARDARFLLWAITANCHRIVDVESGEAVGLGCFPMASMFNHGCEQEQEPEPDDDELHRSADTDTDTKRTDNTSTDGWNSAAGGSSSSSSSSSSSATSVSAFANCAHHFEVATASASSSSISGSVGAGAEGARRPELVVVATKPIQKGGECCYSYVPSNLPREERRSLLLSAYGFDIGLMSPA